MLESAISLFLQFLLLFLHYDIVVFERGVNVISVNLAL
jgi:hypothetical protein